MRMSINPSTGEHLGRDQRLVFDEQIMKFILLNKGESFIRHPITFKSRVVGERQHLVFDRGQMSFVFLPRGIRLLQNPLDPGKLKVGHKLIYHPMKAEYLVLQRSERFRFDRKKVKFVVEKERVASKGVWRL